jgi:hypothetical protein
VNAGDVARKVVVVPDAHAHPSYSPDRFAWLGAFIEREKPSLDVCLGDFADIPSLSAYDRGKRGFEGRRYVHDVAATRAALTVMHAEVRTATPEWLMCLGNHEHRIDRACSDAAEMTGAIGIDDLGYRDHGWQVWPYQSVMRLGGFAFSHHFASGVAGRPIGGMNQAAAMARLLHTSAVAGHSHVWDQAIQTRPDGSRVMAIVAGCYVSHEHREGWSAASEHLWVNGVTVLEDVRAGWAESWRFVSQASLRAAYADRPVAPERPRVEGAPYIDFAGLDYDDGPADTAVAICSYADAARACGRDESTVRFWCQRHSQSPDAYVEWAKRRAGGAA